jgi:hypothetical protein
MCQEVVVKQYELASSTPQQIVAVWRPASPIPA